MTSPQDEKEFVRPDDGGWPFCPTPDCENKVCLWSGLGVCHPCGVKLVGKAEMDRRYAVTREPGGKEWSGLLP